MRTPSVIWTFGASRECGTLSASPRRMAGGRTPLAVWACGASFECETLSDAPRRHFHAVLNKFIFKGSRGGFVALVPQEPENVLRPGLICRRQQIVKSTKFGLPWPTRSHPPAPPQPRARRTRLRRCLSQVLSGVMNFLSPAGAGRGAVLNSSFGVLLRGTA